MVSLLLQKVMGSQPWGDMAVGRSYLSLLSPPPCPPVPPVIHLGGHTPISASDVPNVLLLELGQLLGLILRKIQLLR